MYRRRITSLHNNKNKKVYCFVRIFTIESTVADFIKTVEGENVIIETKTFSELQNSEQVVNGIGPQHFTMLSLLGKGATGKVILVKCTINEKIYAMKVLDLKLHQILGDG